MSIREREFWTWDSFNLFDEFADEWYSIRLSLTFAISMIGAMIGAFAFAFPLELVFLVPESWAWPIGMGAGAVIANIIPRLGRLYAGYGLPDGGLSRHSHYDLHQRGMEYFSLSKEDRLLYPPNIIEIAKDPDLTEKQRAEINKAMLAVYTEIQERNKQRRLVAKRHVDIDSIIEQMRDARKSVEVETNTYREFL